jgi:hypothetical protein
VVLLLLEMSEANAWQHTSVKMLSMRRMRGEALIGVI